MRVPDVSLGNHHHQHGRMMMIGKTALLRLLLLVCAATTRMVFFRFDAIRFFVLLRVVTSAIAVEIAVTVTATITRLTGFSRGGNDHHHRRRRRRRRRRIVLRGWMTKTTMTMARLLLLLLLVCAPTTTAAATATTTTTTDEKDRRPPNFVVFFVDDLGYGDLGFTGHPTTRTPNLDRMAWNGRILTTWYSGCNVCTGSRAALMTGRQFPRTGLPGVIGPDSSYGLNLDEITIAEHLREKAGYATGIVGKWHLGQRKVYLPGNRGFDRYLGIPFSDDMGIARESGCPSDDHDDGGGGGSPSPDDAGEEEPAAADPPSDSRIELESEEDDHDDDDDDHYWPSREWYDRLGFLDAKLSSGDPADESTVEKASRDKGTKWLPLVRQDLNRTEILEQPVDLTTLAGKYADFAGEFLEDHRDRPFFLYVPFSHVHCTHPGSTRDDQYAGCDFRNFTKRGTYGDALAETDWIAGTVFDKIRDLGLEENTLILFTSDNGPWMTRHLSGGSEGLFTGRFAGYDNTAKGTTWEGGIREPAFAYWKGRIDPFTRSSEVVSSLDVFPTLSALAGIPMPDDRPYDGKDMSAVLLGRQDDDDDEGGEASSSSRSKHDFLFFYGTCSGEPYWSIAAVRHGKYKAHWCTAPGLGPYNTTDLTKRYDPPLLFDVEKDPGEGDPISYDAMPRRSADREAMERILKAYAMEKATFVFGNITREPDGPGEGPDRYALCCDRSRDCYCEDDDDVDVDVDAELVFASAAFAGGLFEVGTKRHHDAYHEALGEDEPLPPRTPYHRSMLSSSSSSSSSLRTSSGGDGIDRDDE